MGPTTAPLLVECGAPAAGRTGTGRMGSVEADFAEFVAARWLTLVRAAISLGCTRPEAEDLVQTTLVRCLLKWSRVSAATHRDAYVSRMLVNAHRDTFRTRWCRETPVADLPDVAVADLTDALDTSEVLRRAVAGLSQGQREVVALRFYVRLTEPQIAEALGVRPGTVKSRLSRALAVLAADAGLTELWEGGS